MAIIAITLSLLAFGLDGARRTVKRFDSSGIALPASVNVTIVATPMPMDRQGGLREEDFDDLPVQPYPAISFAEVSGDDDAASSTKVSQLYLPLPVSVTFVKKGDKTVIGVLDRWTIPLEMPGQMAFAFPLVIIFVYTVVWCCCCRRSNRSGLSARMTIEAATCFLCMWADLATKHKVISTTRAWAYIFALLLIMSSWSIVEIVVAGHPDNSLVTPTTVFWIFQPIFLIVWSAFSLERMFVRKFLRRTVNPMARDQLLTDCVASVCCAQFTVLQEAQMMAAQDSRMATGRQSVEKDKVHW